MDGDYSLEVIEIVTKTRREVIDWCTIGCDLVFSLPSESGESINVEKKLSSTVATHILQGK